MPTTKPGRKSFKQVLADLANEQLPPAPEDLRALSDLHGAQLAAFRAAWPGIPAGRRLAIMTDLGELAEDNFEVHIHPASRAALDDADGLVRAAAIRNLWEDDDPDLIKPFMATLVHDPSPEARTAAASALGVYVYLGEMEELPAEVSREIEEALLNVFAGGDTIEVRRHALEAVSYSHRPEAADAIAAALASADDRLRLSALFAMGRNLDRERWGDAVLAALSHMDPPMRLVAARAAGELQLPQAVDALGEMLHDPDPEIQEMSVWALGEIGGEEARNLLQERLAGADEELTELIDDALANAELMDEIADFNLLDLDADDLDDDLTHLN